MPTRIRFFREVQQATESQALLNSHGVKNYTRTRTKQTAKQGEEPYGVDLYVLRDDQIEEAHKIMDYSFGKEFGEKIA